MLLWESRRLFRAERPCPAPYSIVIPPPNVTGTLHMGHAFQDTVMDALIRYHRMRGFDTLWQPGTDHAGIATQMVVERQLNAAGQSRAQSRPGGSSSNGFGQWKADLGRLDRPVRCAAWAPRSIGRATSFTMDPELSQGGHRSLRAALSMKSLIYRGKRLVNWDPVLKTALSDLEVAASEEESGSLWHLQIPARAKARSPMEPASSWWPPPARRPCSGTPRSPCIRTMSAIVHLVGRQAAVAAHRSRHSDHRRRLCRSGLRQRLRQDHTRSRFQ